MTTEILKLVDVLCSHFRALGALEFPIDIINYMVIFRLQRNIRFRNRNTHNVRLVLVQNVMGVN